MVAMTKRTGWRARLGALASEGGPWGGGRPGGGNGDGGKGGGPRNPWDAPGAGSGGPGRPGGRGPSAIDELIRRGRESFGGGLPQRPDGKPLWPYFVMGIGALWLLTTSVHRIGPQERGVVTFLGSYSRTLTPGISLTLPAPFERVTVLDVEEIRTIDIGSTAQDSQKLVLTGDQNIIDLAYSVRWNISSPAQYEFQIADPEQTIAEVAESAMRAVVANVSLGDILGGGKSSIESQVQQRMQEILDGYRAGVRIQGVAIKQADPPDEVNDAFKGVSAAQQAAETDVNQARAYAQQVTARAQGDATAFDKVYEQYRLAPDVTRRRLYYETMEQVLAGVDKTIVETNGVTPYLPLQEAGKPSERRDGTTGSVAATEGRP